jgi:hypothetical protein
MAYSEVVEKESEGEVDVNTSHGDLLIINPIQKSGCADRVISGSKNSLYS